MDCTPLIPLWFVALAVFGAICLTVMYLYAMAYFLWFIFGPNLLQPPKRRTHVNEIKRKLFG